MRAYELAKKLGCSCEEIVRRYRMRGIILKSPMSVLSEEALRKAYTLDVLGEETIGLGTEESPELK